MTKKTQTKKARKLTVNKRTVKDLSSPTDRKVKGGALGVKVSVSKAKCCE